MTGDDLPCASAMFPTSAFYPTVPDSDPPAPDQTAPAPSCCARCPLSVKVKCAALGWGEEFGAWGGLSPADRYDAKARGLTPAQAVR